MSRVPNIVWLPVSGDLDVVTAPRLRMNVEELIDGGCRRVILGMSEVGHIDSAGMAALFSLTRRMRSVGGVLSLEGVRPSVYRALCIACVVDVIPVSEVGDRPQAPVLDPSVRPTWQRSLRVDPSRLSDARSWVEGLLGGTTLSRDEVFDLTLACGEALGNAIDHAHSDEVYLMLACYPDRLACEVTDDGCGFELADGEEVVSECGTEERGRGIRLMRMLADSVSIERKPTGEGTVVRLVKLLHEAAVSGGFGLG